ncbi:MAG: 2,3,4,5-tetrahydropyridine-2,6-dicarboxylate N-succinyltransferase [Hyphomicrobium sp.]
MKKAVLLSFRLSDMEPISGAPGGASWWDKVPSKFAGMSPDVFRRAGFRAVPGCIVRRSAFIAPGVVLLPSFVNLGARIDEGTMVDTWATVGSCAQIGKNCHISGGAGIGGVLEPLQAGPVIIEDNCFIGARRRSGRGRHRRRGLGAVNGRLSRRLDDHYRPRHGARNSSARCRPTRWWCPARCRPRSRCPMARPGPSLYCAIIVKKVDAQTRLQDLDQRATARLSRFARHRNGCDNCSCPACSTKPWRAFATGPSPARTNWRAWLWTWTSRVRRRT